MPILFYDLVGKDLSRPFSPHCWKTKMTFADLGLEYKTIPTHFTEIAGIEAGKSTSLPTIRDGDLLMQDSFEIAKHYATGKPLLGGPQGEPLVRFIESWSQSQLHTWIAGWAVLDICNMLDQQDQVFFRTKREKMFGKSLEDFTANRENSIPELVTRLLPMKLALRHHKFIGGDAPNFADYIVFGALQFLRVASSLQMIPANHPVVEWFDRCLDLHDGLGRSVSEGKLTT